MSRSSTVTARTRPVADSAATSGGLTTRAGTFTLRTDERLQLIDVTDRVSAIVHEGGVREGLAHVFVMHTTCSLFVNEHQLALNADIATFLEQAVTGDAAWRHDDPAHSDCDRANADAHLRSTLLGPGVVLQVSGGELVLGRWQRVLLAEFDGPRERGLRVLVLGAA